VGSRDHARDQPLALGAFAIGLAVCVYVDAHDPAWLACPSWLG
jgi:hypothetical protein